MTSKATTNGSVPIASSTTTGSFSASNKNYVALWDSDELGVDAWIRTVPNSPFHGNVKRNTADRTTSSTATTQNPGTSLCLHFILLCLSNDPLSYKIITEYRVKSANTLRFLRTAFIAIGRNRQTQHNFLHACRTIIVPLHSSDLG